MKLDNALLCFHCLLATLFIQVLDSHLAFSSELMIGVSPIYSQAKIGNSSGSGTASFQGFGYFAWSGVRFPFDPDMLQFGIEISAFYGKSSLGNLNAAVNEDNKLTVIGGELDLRYTNYFVGMRLSRVASRISNSSTASDLSYMIYGPVAGYTFPFSSRFSAKLGLSVQSGTADLVGRSAPVSDYQGFFLVQVMLHNTGPDSDL